MRSLFLKFFLSFWLVIGLILGAAAATGFLYAERLQATVEDFEAGNSKQQASAALERGGRDELQKWRDGTPRNDGVAIFLIDQTGRDISGRDVPFAVERMFERFFPSGWMRPGRWDWPTCAERGMPFEGRMPKVDVVDREDEVVIRAELPGVDKKDLDVSMTDNTVTIKGSTRKEEKEEKGDYYRCEISSGSFSRTVTLPAQVDAGKSSARFKDGVLELKVPKKEKAKRRSIKVE